MPAPSPPPTTPLNQTRPPGGCWTTTCTPPQPPAGISPPGPAPTASRRPAVRRPRPRTCPPSGAAAWLDAERANLHAATEYAADRACFPHAFALPAAISGFLAARGHWDQSTTLHRTALAAARQAGDQL